MPGSGWQRAWVRATTMLLVLGVMTMIFCFSTEDAEHSDRTSGFLSRAVISVIHPGYGEYGPERQKAVYDEVQYIVRKAAHFCEYLLLGLALRLWTESWLGGKKLKERGREAVSFGAGALYAGTDELHQLMIDGRSGQWTDVLWDSCGVAAGVMAGLLLIRLAGRRRKTGR